MPYSLTAPAPELEDTSSVCTRRGCDDPAVVALAAVELDELTEEPRSVITSRVCATHARDAVDELLRRACIGAAASAPGLALSPIVED